MLAIYLTIVGLAQGWTQAVSLLVRDKFLVAPVTLSFGVQVGLYAYLRAIIRIRSRGSAAMTGASGGTSTVAMVACCAHRVADLLPLLGLSAAAGFLAAYKTPFMILGLAVSCAGIFLISRRIVRYKAQHAQKEVA
jgi:Cu+-exporting ATPase